MLGPKIELTSRRWEGGGRLTWTFFSLFRTVAYVLFVVEFKIGGGMGRLMSSVNTQLTDEQQSASASSLSSPGEVTYVASLNEMPPRALPQPPPTATTLGPAGALGNSPRPIPFRAGVTLTDTS